jgi:ionotropic glutamate receptor
MASSMWWFFSLIMTSSYTANLAAFLTMERLEPSIESAEALSKQTKIKYGTVEGGATQAFFRESNYSTFQRMWTSMIQARPSVFEKNNADGVKRVQTTKNRMYAFLMESSQIEYEIETKCDLKQVGNWLDSKGYGIAMPIDYPYRSAINTAILKLQEDSKLIELKDKWWKKMRDEPSCPSIRSSEKSSSEVALANVGGVFLVLGIGVSVAFVLAILEFLWNVRNVSVEEHVSLDLDLSQNWEVCCR